MYRYVVQLLVPMSRNIGPLTISLFDTHADVPGNFICLRIDTTLLKSQVKFEAGEREGGSGGDKAER